ncbi:Structural maintenance of chromosomes protein 5 [Rhizina undulata]
MPSATGKRSAHDQDEELSADDAASSVFTPQSDRKRARLSNDNQGNGANDDSEDEEQDDEMRYEGNILPEADPDEHEEEDLLGEDFEIEPPTQPHQPGSIVRVKLKNFVTYSQVEVFPGPSLNMVIGPNGTGKSTIVCAICLGLGWGPGHLGRAKEVSEFVKHGSQEAIIEIELQGREEEISPVIKRKIGRENNLSAFWINNKHSNQKQVISLARSYNVQIDNLCQFLPQDRVVEFAGLSSIELLNETQRAAAPPVVLEQHQELKKLSKRCAQTSADNDADKAALTNMEQRQASLQQDVDRLRERQEILQKIELLNKAKPFVAYRISRVRAKETKEAHLKCDAELKALRREVGPAMENPKQKKKYKDAITRGVAERKRLVADKEKEMKKIKEKKISQIDENIKDSELSIDAERQRERARKEEIRKLKEKIETIKRKLEAEPEEVDLQYYNHLILEKNREIRDLHDEVTQYDHPIKSLMEKKSQVKNSIAQMENELESLDSVAGQRENLLARMGPDTHRAWKWYLDNRDKFEAEVFGPPILNCSIKDPKFADAVESLMNRNEKLSIVCQTSKDFNTLLEACFGSKKNGTRGMALAEVTIKDYSTSRAPTLQQQLPGPLTKEEMHQFGFDGYALDYLDGPEPVLNMLCHENRMHATPISLKEFTPTQNQRMEQTAANAWLCGNTMFQVRRRREYNASTTSVRRFGPAQIFKVQQVDLGLKTSLQRQILEKKGELEEIQMELVEKDKERKAAKAKYEAAQDAKKAIEHEKGKKQQAWTQYNRLKAQLEPAEDDLKQKLEGGSNFKENIQALEDKLDVMTTDRAKLAMEFAQLAIETIELHNEVIKISIREAEAASDLELLELKNRDIQMRLDEKERVVVELARIAEAAQAKAKRNVQTCKDIMVNLSDEEKEFMNEIPTERTLEEIDNEIEAGQARLELLHEGDPNALRQYEERAVKIEQLKAKIEKQDKKLDEIRHAIKELRDQWEPEVDRLVEKISSAFSRSFKKIGCAGEVRVRKEEEFEKWAIEILVKFRETEKLQLLTNQRQSGGERAVSTVFYLMALQSLARSPFRVVDEINQGMDPRNERLVHHRMVNIACQKYTSQYFLITPKLLPDLKYHPRMKIHCINSGDWIEEDSIMNYDKFLVAGRRLKGK